MLQIITGRFFGDTERYSVENSLELFTVSEIESIEVLKGLDLDSQVGHRDGGTRVLVRFNSGLPRPANGPKAGGVVAVGESEALAQLACLLQVATERVWTPDQERLQRIVRARHWPIQTLLVNDSPSSEHARRVIGAALALPRAVYLKVAAAAAALDRAIRAAEFSYDAAFANVIFAIESLVPPNDGSLNWDEYPDRTRGGLDEVLNAASPEVAAGVRTVLLQDQTLKATARFLAFVEGSLNQSYFSRCDAVPRSHLREVLRNAYATRSGYVHALESAGQRSGYGLQQTLVWRKGHPHLSLQGAITLAFQLVRAVVNQGPHLTEEAGVDWWSDLPGVVEMPLAYQHWLHKPEAFSSESIRRRFADVVRYVVHTVPRPETQMTDLSAAVRHASKLLPTTPKNRRRSIVALVTLWRMVVGETRLPWSSAFLEIHAELLEQASPESAAICVLSGQALPWLPDEAEAMWRDYLRNRYGERPGNLLFPHVVETAIRAMVANCHLAAGDLRTFCEVADELSTECGSRPVVLSHIATAKKSSTPLDVRVFLGWPLDVSEDSSDGAEG